MTQEKQKEMTIREKGVVIALMATISFASNTTVSLVLPFLPQVGSYFMDNSRIS